MRGRSQPILVHTIKQAVTTEANELRMRLAGLEFETVAKDETITVTVAGRPGSGTAPGWSCS